MSLNIYSDKEKVPADLRIVRDIEAEFECVTLENDELTRTLLKNIENAEYDNAVSYIDCNGYKLPKENLSVGCKIAIMAGMFTNCVFDTVECISKDRSNIVSYVCKGNILDTRRKRGYSKIGVSEINVVYDGTYFDDIDVLNAHTRRVYTDILSTAISVNSDPEILINLEPGIYNIGDASKEDKNYIYNVFRRLGRSEASVKGFSYEDIDVGDVDTLIEKGYSALILNRADMYLTGGTLDKLVEYSAEGIALLDYKGEDFEIEPFKKVDIFRCSDRIEIGLSYT